jgi:capsular polysaccharide biosynthesis protein
MKTPSATTSRSRPLRLAVVVFLSVFLLVVIIATLVTFILPETFASSTRVRLIPRTNVERATNSPLLESPRYGQFLVETEIEIIQSEEVLTKVVEGLDINTEWGKRYNEGEKFKTSESVSILKARLDVRPVQNTSLIEIRVFNDEPQEAARIANAISASYSAYASSHPEAPRVEVVDIAHPNIRPVRPNKPLNIILGIIIGVVIGFGCGLFTYWFGLVYQRHKAANIESVAH